MRKLSFAMMMLGSAALIVAACGDDASSGGTGGGTTADAGTTGAGDAVGTTGGETAGETTGQTGGETTGGETTGVEPECVVASDCPELALPPCDVLACVQGECSTALAPAGSICPGDGGKCFGDAVCTRDGACQLQPKSCDDANACTEDTCDNESGDCVHTPVPDCGGECTETADCLPADVGACATLECDEGACKEVKAFDGADCSSAIALDECTVAGTCTGGECVKVEKDCDDGIECTIDTCVFGDGCKHEEEDLLCSIPDCEEDGDCVGLIVLGGLCKTEKCVLGKCLAGNGKDGNACALEAWADNPCIEGGVCTEGSCTPKQKNCDDQLDCTVDACDPETAQCVYTPLEEDCGEQCNEDGKCATGFYCDNGLIPGIGEDTCVPLKDDGVACTSDDTCGSGECGGCVDLEILSAGWCYTQSTAEVGQPCKADAECVSGNCTALCPVNLTGVCQCVSSQDCLADEVCEAGILGNTCVKAPNAKPLGEACSGNTDCKSGQCEGNVCVCNVDADCAEGEYCNAIPAFANKCVAIKAECASCALDKECGAGAICLAVGLPVSLPKCITADSKETGEDCCKNAQCKTGSCKSGQCAE